MKFIEVTFPVKAVSLECQRERLFLKGGHISKVLTWWARKALAVSRAVNYAALIPAPSGGLRERRLTNQFIALLSRVDSVSNIDIISRARRNILRAYNGRPPRVLDPFAGGGSIPLEAMRIGCEAYASDLNPVAVLILKLTLEYPQRYGKRLYDDVKRWAEWVYMRVREELEQFYNGDVFLWVRTIPCPSCNMTIPLYSKSWLENKKRRLAFKPVVRGGRVEFEIVENPDFNPSKGTVSRGRVQCPVCNTVIPPAIVRRLFETGRTGHMMVAVVNVINGRNDYRLAVEDDMALYRKAGEYLEVKRSKLWRRYLEDPLPDEVAPGAVSAQQKSAPHAFHRFSDFYNARQALAAITFVEKIRDAYDMMLAEGYDREYAKAITTYLAVAFAHMLEYMNVTSSWHPDKGEVGDTFQRPGIPLMWDYAELNPIGGMDGSWMSMIERRLLPVLKELLVIPMKPAVVLQADAARLPFPDGFFDAIITDPPYYDYISYSHLSDFFYVWLKRAIGFLYQELFANTLSPKVDEVTTSMVDRSVEEGRQRYTQGLVRAFKEMYRVLRDDGIAVIVYTHMSLKGWEPLVDALFKAGFKVTAAWAIESERKNRYLAMGTAALLTTVYIVARKNLDNEIGRYEDVKEELRNKIGDIAERMWSLGYRGSDLLNTTIGSALPIICRYREVRDANGNTVEAGVLLRDVKDMLKDYLVGSVLGEKDISPAARFYIRYISRYGMRRVSAGEARSLALESGVDLEELFERGLVKREDGYVRVLGALERDHNMLNGSRDLIDVLHMALIHLKNGDKGMTLKVLGESGWDKNDLIYRVAQALAESLPPQNSEKRLLYMLASSSRA